MLSTNGAVAKCTLNFSSDNAIIMETFVYTENVLKNLILSRLQSYQSVHKFQVLLTHKHSYHVHSKCLQAALLNIIFDNTLHTFAAGNYVCLYMMLTLTEASTFIHKRCNLSVTEQ